MLTEVVNWIVDTVGALGYSGIFAMMFLESSFFPFPSEVAMIPAGHLASKGEMSLTVAVVAGILGSIAGALFNYYLAAKFGRSFLLKYGKYFFLNEEHLNKLERFFKSHGEISVFSGRLVPGVRQYISLPAGMAKMNIKHFILYTGLGAGTWVVVLALLGYFIGENEAYLKEHIRVATMGALGFVALLVAIYYYFNKKRA